MSKYVMAVDPGSIHTGWAVGEVHERELRSLVACGEVSVNKKLAPQDRVASIIDEIRNVAVDLHVEEMWTELYMPYGARRGSMWNTTLVGALLYLPVTRQDKVLDCFAVPPPTWKSWFRKQPYDPVMEALQYHDVKLSDDLVKTMCGNPHILDAVGILIFAVYGAEDVDEIGYAEV